MPGRLSDPAVFDAATGEHIYVSTACLHDRHELCRLVCKVLRRSLLV